MPRTEPDSPSPPPPPANFPFATGGFDFPQASASPPPPLARSRPSPRARVNQLTEFLNQHTRQTTNEDDRPQQRRPRTSRDTGNRRRSTQRLPRHAEREPGTGGTPSERYLIHAPAHIRHIRAVIEDPATDVLDPLSDRPRNPLRRDRSPASSEADHGDYAPHMRAKRRKYADNPPHIPRNEYDGFKYGYKGQVARGRLRMQVVSCDGGEHDRDSSLYRVQNVLRNDKSVYCSQTACCNLLLKHIGEMPFCLEKMVIRAPDRGFSAPVQEGMIFVSMSPDKLISGTAAYEIEYNAPDSASSPPSEVRLSPPLSPTPSLPQVNEDEQLTFEEALRDEEVWRRSRHMLAQRVESLRYRSRRHPEIRDHLATHQAAADDDDIIPNECPYHIEEGDSSAAGISAPTPPPFTTTTESEPEDAEGSDHMPSAAIMADRLRRESRYRSEDEDDDDRDDLIQHPLAALRRAEPLTAQPFLEPPGSLQSHHERAQRWRAMRNPIEPIRATRLLTPSRIQAREEYGSEEAVLKPSARFFIQRHRNKITVKFHPAM